MASEGRSAKVGIRVAFALLIPLCALDFYFDVHARDAFSWMDPYQYYEFALEVLADAGRFDDFEVPSLFPFFVLPLVAIERSIPASLWTHFAFSLLLMWSLHRLCRELEIETPSVVVVLLVFSSPLLIGLSRELYIEYALSALVATTFLYWLRFQRAMDFRSGLCLAALLGLGFMTKMTSLLFVLLPISAAILARVVTRRDRAALAMIAATVLPIGLAMLIQTTVFSASLGYYLSLGNTTLPIMYLIGPTEWLSWSSFAYYPGVLFRFMLGLLTPLLLLAVWLAWRERGAFGWQALDGRRTSLWLWLIGPLVLLIPQSVKEPRHVAPSVVAAVLLLVMGIEGLPGQRSRRALLALALLLALIQFAAITGGAVDVPYFIDRPLRVAAIEDEMRRADANDAHSDAVGELGDLHWRYDQNVALLGFSPNQALALTWSLFPAIVFDLETVDDADRPQRSSESIPYHTFEDLYIFTSLNTYNRRCGWHDYYGTLPRAQVIANADFLILRGVDAVERPSRFPNHVLVATIERRDGPIIVLRSRQPTTPYRSLYARRFLEANPHLIDEERRLVALDLLMTDLLSGGEHSVEEVSREFPIIRDGGSPARNLYWIGGYKPLIVLADQLLRTQEAAARAPASRD